MVSTAGLAEPTAYLENAQIIGAGQNLQVFRVPTTDAKGNVNYYNLNIELPLLNDGSIDTDNVETTATVSPTVSSLKFIPGTYSDGYGGTCNVATAALQSGRSEVSISCLYKTSTIIQLSAASGVMSGHPYEVDLKQAKIDKIKGYQNYAWGRVGNSNSTWWGCFYTNTIISARQIGDTLSLTNYRSDNIADCGAVLTKTK